MNSSQKTRDSRDIYIPPPLRNRHSTSCNELQDPYKNCAVALNLHSCKEENYEQNMIRKSDEDCSINTSEHIAHYCPTEQIQDEFKGNRNAPPCLRKTQKPIQVDEYDVFQIDSYNIVPVAERNEQAIFPLTAPPLCVKAANVERYSPLSGARIVEPKENIVDLKNQPEKDTLADMSAIISDTIENAKQKEQKPSKKSSTKKNKSSAKIVINEEDSLPPNSELKKVGALKESKKKKGKKTKVLEKGDVASQCTLLKAEKQNDSLALIVEPLVAPTSNHSAGTDSGVRREPSRPDKQSVEVDIDNWENLDTNDCNFEVLMKQFQGSCSIPPTCNISDIEVIPLSQHSCLNSQDTQPPSSTLALPSSNSLKKGKRSEPPLNYSEFEHILELYDFPNDLRTGDLYVEFQSFLKSGFDIKWVDDTHCLAVFSDKQEADRALRENSGLLVKARPVVEASSPSKWKILKAPGDWQMPYKARPQTSNLTARRLISHHLGLKNHITPTQRRSEELKLRDAKAKKLQKLQKMDQPTYVWL